MKVEEKVHRAAETRHRSLSALVASSSKSEDTNWLLQQWPPQRKLLNRRSTISAQRESGRNSVRFSQLFAKVNMGIELCCRRCGRREPRDFEWAAYCQHQQISSSWFEAREIQHTRYQRYARLTKRTITCLLITFGTVASDPAQNPYWKRDVRRAYPKLSVVTQLELSSLLIEHSQAPS